MTAIVLSGRVLLGVEPRLFQDALARVLDSLGLDVVLLVTPPDHGLAFDLAVVTEPVPPELADAIALVLERSPADGVEIRTGLGVERTKVRGLADLVDLVVRLVRESRLPRRA